MLIAWRDALALLKSLSEPTDAMLREGVLFLAAGPPQHLGLELEAHVIHDARLALEDAGYVQWTDWNHMSGTITGLRVTSRGMQALGEWPALYTILTPASLSQLLEDLADYAADPEKQAILRRAAQRARSWSAETLRESIISLGAAWARSRHGLGA
jgi:hypothetical protein